MSGDHNQYQKPASQCERCGEKNPAEIHTCTPQKPVACIVKDCHNRNCEGLFVGALCSPCHTFITTGEGKYSQAYRNAQREWQGLTAQDLVDVGAKNYIGAIWADAKLKEKNT